MPRYVVVIPVFNHDRYLERLVHSLLAMSLPCILVDDGSEQHCADMLTRIASENPEHVTLVRHSRNMGKGTAVIDGFRAADKAGYTHAVQIDADAQHNVDDVPVLIALSLKHPNALITGTPIYDDSVPRVRLYFRYLTHAMVSVNTLTFRLRDAMCGFRVYPVQASVAIANRVNVGARMDFDTDLMVRLDWDDVEIIAQPTRVKYPVDGVSHFRMWRDNVRMTSMHIRLFFGMLLRSPRLIARRIRAG